MTASRIDVACVTHVGQVRKNNQDTFRAEPALGLWLVADGMGGHAGGEIASALAADAAVAAVRAGKSLEAALDDAHRAIIAGVRESPDHEGMGTTLVAARFKDDTFEVAWIGDSRAYLYDHSLHPLTRDHTYVNQLIEAGALTPDQARTHPHRHVVVQALGIEPRDGLRVDRIRGTWSPGTRIVLCSDGLTEVMDDPTLAQTLGDHDASSQALVDRLIQQALDAGAPDNTTVIVLRRKPDDRPESWLRRFYQALRGRPVAN